ncbi:hypothetical protein SLEP1_g45515 [Rubroshorea leprosula]|uniref:Uncharacterized protein n=1 Tax=Rubroshorea leprosula TaxID=152421 RepID=A0AAV5LKX8_9ROSI|nr:hypothetical protein SLEP1_g45515 [Rubroshorea leprosula]
MLLGRSPYNRSYNRVNQSTGAPRRNPTRFLQPEHRFTTFFSTIDKASTLKLSNEELWLLLVVVVAETGSDQISNDREVPDLEDDLVENFMTEAPPATAPPEVALAVEDGDEEEGEEVVAVVALKHF